jgi:signal transduction histidine kinase
MAETFSNESPGVARPPDADWSDGWRPIILGMTPRRRRYLVAVTLALVLVIGIADYLLGFELSILVFYIIPVCLAVASVGWRFGAFTSVVSVASWLVGDYFAGAKYENALVPLSNALFALATYLVVVGLLKTVLTLHREMEERVQQRTAALRSVIAERERLERALLDAGQRERHQIGQELHDDLGQHFTGTALACQVLVDKLGDQGLPEEESDARRIVNLIEEGIEKSRRLARGLLVTEVPQDALVAALRELAVDTTRLSKVKCEFIPEGDLPISDNGTATQLFYIIQEAVRNAVRHAAARRIVITLRADDEYPGFIVQDDGVGLPPAHQRGEGLGLRIMAHRAEIIGWTFNIATPLEGGTLITCRSAAPLDYE